jgi:DnaJ family protein C protein 17
LDNKRKALAEDLEAREREFKKQKAGEATEAQRKRQELERLKEEGRRLREMKMNEANAGEQARQQEEAERDERRRAREGGAAAANGGGPAGVVELGPLDKTLKVKWQKSIHPSLGSVEALTTFFRTALAPHDPDLDSVVLSSKTLAQPSKGKFGSGVVAFRSLKAAVRAVKGKAADPDGMWRGFEVDWAAGQPPAALGGASTNPAPPVAAASPDPQPIPVRGCTHLTPFSGGLDMSDFQAPLMSSIFVRPRRKRPLSARTRTPCWRNCDSENGNGNGSWRKCGDRTRRKVPPRRQFKRAG